MDQAIYEPTTQKIFGVRGQWLFQFNSVTGVLENSLRFRGNVAGPSTIVAISGNLYIGSSWQTAINWTLTPYAPDEDIYVVNAAAFVTSSRLNLGAKNTFGITTQFNGFRFFSTNGTSIIGMVQDGQLFIVNPSNLAGYASANHKGITDTAFDSTNGVIWMTSSFDPDIYCIDPSNPAFNYCFDSNGNLNTICGICYNQAQNKVYAVDGTFAFYSFSAALAVPGFSNFHVNTFSSGRINSTAFRIKSVNGLPSNPLNGQVLMPTWADDAVLVINPATDTVTSVKTGFTAPFDIVSTPTKNFAVQTGSTGLKEIV